MRKQQSHHECDNKRGQLHIGNQYAIYCANYNSRQQHGDQRQPHIGALADHAGQHTAADTHSIADRQIDSACKYDKTHADCQNRILGNLIQNVYNIRAF